LTSPLMPSARDLHGAANLTEVSIGTDNTFAHTTAEQIAAQTLSWRAMSPAACRAAPR